MENSKNGLDPLLEKAVGYAKTYFELNKLKTINKVATIFASLAARVITTIFLGLFVILASIGAAFWAGELLGELHYGFFCVAGFYALIYLIVHFLMGKSIKRKIKNSIISQILK